MPKESKNKNNLFQSPKGMRDFLGEKFYEKQGFYTRAESIAGYYGFSGIETPIVEHAEVFTKGVGEHTDIVEKEMYDLHTRGGDHLVMRPEGTAGVMRSYIEHGMSSLPQPIMLYYGGPFFRHDKPQKGRYRQLYQFGLEIIGSQKPEYDVLIIQTGFRILKETGRNIVVKINSLGDSETRKNYLKKLINYYQKHENEISKKDRGRLSTNPLRVLDSKEPETKEVNKNAPTCLETLNTSSKAHFDMVIKGLSEAGINYEIDHTLVRGLDYYSHTVFEFIVYDENGQPSHALGGGGRYDGLARAMGYNKDIPAVGLGIGVDRTIESAKKKVFIPQNKQHPDFYFIQTGEELNNASFHLREILYQNNAKVVFAPQKGSIGQGLGIAENLKIPFVLILGKDEAQDKTITLRNMNNREQQTLTFDEFDNYLKLMKKNPA
ncbi:MAG: histidine--tRNA ligase [Candidatus Pacebacteria bacterium]|nr:histidine--tRNA ligase [Candidatus Paceibacterota bacterium]